MNEAFIYLIVIAIIFGGMGVLVRVMEGPSRAGRERDADESGSVPVIHTLPRD